MTSRRGPGVRATCRGEGWKGLGAQTEPQTGVKTGKRSRSRGQARAGRGVFAFVFPILLISLANIEYRGARAPAGQCSVMIAPKTLRAFTRRRSDRSVTIAGLVLSAAMCSQSSSPRRPSRATDQLISTESLSQQYRPPSPVAPPPTV
ncbi:hypothetical protein EVG20_g6612 [Dentipellis fragilis]|uniref:Uncharacterized protein n=1 Tax=Dentipellis fragilis TaxID=205917 RepID=A0A4Y9YL55_9AGAM|nr:hypothetical protein EVG20_g6612 [Dentipellis fragilis]